MKKITVYTLALCLILVTGAVFVEAGEIHLISPYTSLEEGESYIFSITLPSDSENWLSWVQGEFKGYKNFQYLDAKKSKYNLYILARIESQSSTAGYHGMKIASDFEIIFQPSGLSNNKGVKLSSLLDGVYKTNLEYIPNSLVSMPIYSQSISADVIPKQNKNYIIVLQSDTLNKPNYYGTDRYHTKGLIVDNLRDSNFLHLTTCFSQTKNLYFFYIAFTLSPDFSTDQTLQQLGKDWATAIEDNMEAYGKNVTFDRAFEVVLYQLDY